MKTKAVPVIGKRSARSALGWLYQRLRFWDREAKLNRMYDKCTLHIMARVLGRSSNCVDVGCHQGVMLRSMMELAPEGTHHAFEPIPAYAAALRERFTGAHIHEVALSDTTGTAEFRYVHDRPAYSGLKERAYPQSRVHIELIEVQTRPLDDILPPDLPIQFMKVDVEGGELQVFRGAVRTLQEYKPFLVFEHGLGAADYYQTGPEDVYELLVQQCGMRISLLPDWLNRRSPLQRDAFVTQFVDRLNFYFLAHR